MFDINNMQKSLPSDFPKIIWDGIDKNYPKSGTILGGFFDLGKTIYYRKESNMSFRFKIYAFRVVYYLFLTGYYRDFLNSNYHILKSIFDYAQMYKKIFWEEHEKEKNGKVPSSYFDHTSDQFENDFILCIGRYIYLTLEYKNLKYMIPMFCNAMTCYKTNCNLIDVFISVFVEDIFIDQCLMNYVFTPNMYDRENIPKVTNVARFTGDNINNAALYVISALK